MVNKLQNWECGEGPKKEKNRTNPVGSLVGEKVGLQLRWALQGTLWSWTVGTSYDPC